MIPAGFPGSKNFQEAVMAKTISCLVERIIKGENLSKQETEMLQKTPVAELLSAIRDLGLDEAKFLMACLNE